MEEPVKLNANTPDSPWTLTSEPEPVSEQDEPIAPSDTPLEIRGQCLLFCSRCGEPSDGAREFCLRCGAKRRVSCGQ